MNSSMIGSDFYKFKDFTDGTFKATSIEHSLSKKLKDNIKTAINYDVRILNEFLITINKNIFTIWKFKSNRRNLISGCQQYYLPSNVSINSANQCLIVFDDKSNEAKHSIVVDNGGIVRFWPNLSLSQQYIDQKIAGISNDVCVHVCQIFDDLVAIMFRSHKLVICDLQDFSNAGVVFKQFSQYSGFMGGISKCLNSLFIGSTISDSQFKNVKVDTSLQEEIELLVMFDNNINSLKLDILYNGNFSSGIIDRSFIKTAIFDQLLSNSSLTMDLVNVNLVNFDLTGHIIYLLVELFSLEKDEVVEYVLVTYNRKMDAVDNCAAVSIEPEGDVELRVVDEENLSVDQSCLLVIIKDDNHVFVVETLTGIIKSQLDLSPADPHQTCPRSIVGWGLTKLQYDKNCLLTVLAANLQLVSLRHCINPFDQKSLNISVSDKFNLNPSISSLNSSFSLKKPIGAWQEGDVLEPATGLDFMAGPPAKSRRYQQQSQGQMGDSLTPDQSSVTGLNSSTTSLNDDSDQLVSLDDDSSYYTFRKSLVFYWTDYKSQSTRILTPLLEESEMSPSLSMPIFVLRALREIIDELPLKDPRWKKFIDPRRYCFSNKSLQRSQQLTAKKESLRKLMQFLEENRQLSGCVAPLSVHHCLFRYPPVSSSATDDHSSTLGPLWSLVDCLRIAGELLEFVRVLNELADSEEFQPISLIISSVCQHVLSVEKRVKPIEVISQEVSLVPSLIRAVATHMAECSGQLSSRQATEVSAVVLLAKVLCMGLRSSLTHRTKMRPLLPTQKQHGRLIPACWITEEEPIGVADSLMEIIMMLNKAVKQFESMELFGWTYDLANTLLECFQWRLDSAFEYGTTQSELDLLRTRFVDYRHRLIKNIIEEPERMRKGLELADRFHDYEWLANICEVLDSSSSNIGSSMTVFEFLDREGFAEYVLDWYEARLADIGLGSAHSRMMGRMQRVLEKIRTTAGEGGRRSSGRGGWMADVAGGQWLDAGKSLLAEAGSSFSLVARRRHLLSLGKLALLASDDQQRPDLVAECSVRLQIVKLQEQVPADMVDSILGYSARSQPVIPLDELVRLHLAAWQQNLEHVDPVLKAFELLSLVSNSPFYEDVGKHTVTSEQVQSLLDEVWCQIILKDDWAAIATTESTASRHNKANSSSVAKVIRRGLESGMIHQERMLQLEEVDRLFEERPELQQLAQSPEAIFCVKRVMDAFMTSTENIVRGEASLTSAVSMYA